MIKIDLEEQTRITDQVSIPRMYATRKRNKPNNRDGEVGTIQQAGIIHYEHEWEFQQWSQAQRNIIELRRAVSRTKRVERHCELANNRRDKLHKVSTPWLDDHQFKNE